MNSKYYQESENLFHVGDLVCYKQTLGTRLCGIITDTNEHLVKIYWCISRDEVDISPLSYPPVRRDGWIAAGLLKGIGSLEVVSKKKLDK
jgi:hypothetical protein